MKVLATALATLVCGLAMFEVVWARNLAWEIMRHQTKALINASIADPCNDMMDEVFEVSWYKHWQKVVYFQDPYVLYSRTLGEYGRQGAKAWFDTEEGLIAWDACSCNPVDSDPSASTPMVASALQ
jgi:hypothetical protein